VKKSWSYFISLVGVNAAFLAIPAKAQFVYVTNEGGNNVSGYQIGSEGALTSIPESPFPAGTEPVSITVTRNGRFAYVANLHGGNISAYHVSSNGALAPLPGSPFKAGIEPVSISADPARNFCM
jgi:6-phosphogluconolactonase